MGTALNNPAVAVTDAIQWLQPVLHPVYARLLCAELQARGHAPEQILAGTGLDWMTLHSDNGFLSLEQIHRLIVHGMEISGCGWLGIDVGLRTQLASHGALGTAMSASRHLHEALQVAERYAAFRQYLVTLHWQQTPTPLMAVVEQMPLGALREFLLTLLVAGLAQVLRSMTGQHSQPMTCIEWPFPEPTWAAQYQRIVAHNSFGHDQLRFHFDPALLPQPSLSADAEVLQSALRECELQLDRARLGSSLSQRIRLLLSGSARHWPGLDEVARHENMSSRTLIRHLQREHITFQQLLDDVRRTRARWLLENTRSPVDEIASQLGYVDTSNFSRTFRRWFGITPGAWRQQHGRLR